GQAGGRRDLPLARGQGVALVDGDLGDAAGGDLGTGGRFALGGGPGAGVLGGDQAEGQGAGGGGRQAERQQGTAFHGAAPFSGTRGRGRIRVRGAEEAPRQDEPDTRVALFFRPGCRADRACGPWDDARERSSQ